MREADSAGSFQSFRQIVVLVVVGLGYALAIADEMGAGGVTRSTLETAVLIGAGILFLILNLNEERLLDPDPKPWKVPAYFAVQLALFTLSVYLLGTINGIWLVAMPLVGTGVGRLSNWGALAVSAYLLLTMGWRPAVEAGLDAGLSLMLSVLPAVIFVALFVKLLVREEEARNEAEGLASRLEAANRQLAAHAAQAEELATSKERNRLAREIHDSLGHYLTVINVQLQAALAVIEDDKEKAVGAIQTARDLSQEGLASVRQSVSALRESPLGDRPLPEAVGALVKETESAGIVAELAIHGQPRRLDPATELALYRAAQEGLTNTRKHARASRVDLTLDYGQPERVLLAIQDNGVGTAGADNAGFGLLGVRERVGLLGGSIHIESKPGEGFKMAVELPG